VTAAVPADGLDDRAGVVGAYEALRHQLITHGTCRDSWGAVVLLRSGLAAWVEAYQHRESCHEPSIATRPTAPQSGDHADVINLLATMTLAHFERTPPCSRMSRAK
jgi:hypothetical protein